MEDGGGKPACGQEALDLLNCVVDSSFDKNKCVPLLLSLRYCVLTKKVKEFSLADQEQKDAKPVDKKT